MSSSDSKSAINTTSILDRDALRRAIAMRAGPDGWARLPSVVNVYKVLTPGAQKVAGFVAAVREQADAFAIHLPDGDGEREVPLIRACEPWSDPQPTLDECIELAFAFGRDPGLKARGSDDYDHDDRSRDVVWADYSRMTQALRWLLPEHDFGKDIQKWFLEDGRWRLAKDRNGRMLVRLLAPKKQARAIEWLVPGDGAAVADPYIAPGLAHAVHHVWSVPMHLLANGTCVIIRPKRGGAPDYEAVFDRTSRTWLLADGTPLQKAYWFIMDECRVLEEDLTDEQRNQVERNARRLATKV